MNWTRIILTVLGISAVGPTWAGDALPGADLAPGGRACFGLKVAEAEPGKLPAHGVTRMLIELHNEQFDGQDPILWGRFYAEVNGEPNPGYVYDGCGPGDTRGTLHCGLSCDDGSITLAPGPEGGMTIAVGADGARLKTCGSSIAEIGGFVIAPGDLPQGATLSPRNESECRAAMEHFEKLLAEEENE